MTAVYGHENNLNDIFVAIIFLTNLSSLMPYFPVVIKYLGLFVCYIYAKVKLTLIHNSDPNLFSFKKIYNEQPNEVLHI